ncbi:LPS export ABC transporter periplasmic protein LptC [Bernardetia sp. Wsw4-3y2]|uniref:LPS export ABC transporter periplasmic protein LptC n=1 Tax=Bernardetia sp. Wsw4-3y2 TaxID=3127471 RepID=UPI0030D45F0A
MKYKLYHYPFFAILSLVTFAFIFQSCGEDEMSEEEKAKNTIIATFENIRRIYSEEGLLKIKIEAPLEYIYQNEDLYYPSNFRVSMYDTKGKITTTLTADSGRYERISKLYHAYGNVEVVNYEQEQKVNTPELHWNEFKREIYTEKEIAVKTPTETLYGIGMTSNETFSKYKVWQPTGSFIYKERTQGFEKPDSTDMQNQKNTPYSNLQQSLPTQ